MTDNPNIPEGYIWSEEYQCYRNAEDKAVDEGGKPLVGFADPKFRARYQNKSGRPKGRNRSALEKAQDLIDSLAETTVENLRLIASNQWEKLGLKEPISPATMVNANKTLLDKAISQEKEKLAEEQVKGEETLEEQYTPTQVVDFSSRKK